MGEYLVRLSYSSAILSFSQLEKGNLPAHRQWSLGVTLPLGVFARNVKLR